jgi:pimeloyl-ACP methyl ester carboxylesterase
METRAGAVTVHHIEHGAGTPVLVLHGAGVDHREAEACFEPVFDGVTGFRRIYPDLPGMGRTPATGLESAEDVLDTLLEVAGSVGDGTAYLLVGHSAGAYYAQAMAARVPQQVAGLALVCPLLPGVRDVPGHGAVAGSGELGDEEFRSYFVIWSPQMLERYERYVAPAAALVDQPALERIGRRWELAAAPGPAYPGPTLVVAGRQDSVVGYAAALDLADHYPHATVAVVDGAGHALPHEQPHLLRALLTDWLGRIGHPA